MRSIQSCGPAVILLLLAACEGAPSASGAVREPTPGPGAATKTAAPPPAPAPPPTPADTPEAVARAYLERGSRSQDVRDLVDPSCHANEDIMRVSAIRVMGVPMTLRSLTVTPGAVEGTTASVRYEASGSAHAEQSDTTLLGARVKIQAVHVESTTQSGSLSMVRVDGHWRVGCAPPTDQYGGGLGQSGSGRGGS